MADSGKIKKLRKKEKKDKSNRFKTGKGLKIIDDFDDIRPFERQSYVDSSKPDFDIPDMEDEPDELPQIAGIVDERPIELQAMERFSTDSKWRKVTGEDRLNLNFFDEGHDRRPPSNSPPRRPKGKQSSPPMKGRERSASPPSPPRRHKASSPPRRPKETSSPPRRHREPMSPPRRHRELTSPPRRPKETSSPPRRPREPSSPPRRPREPSSPRRRPREPSSPRRRPREPSSPPRRPREPSSPPRRTGEPISPPRRPRSSVQSHRDKQDFHRSRNSPRTRTPSQSPPRRSKDTEYSTTLMKKTLDGKLAGIQSASALRDEMIDHRRRENQIFEAMSESVSGRHAKTKIRDRETGKERDFETESRAKQEEQKALKERQDQYNKWGKGLKQVADQAARVDSALHEMSKPLARYKDDEDLDVHLRNQDRDGDPMLKFLSKKRGNPSKPAYSGPPPLPNRFGIPPGYRWDGVDRSGGYEKDWFGRINTRKAIEEEAYKWSVEDL